MKKENTKNLPPCCQTSEEEKEVLSQLQQKAEAINKKPKVKSERVRYLPSIIAGLVGATMIVLFYVVIIRLTTGGFSHSLQQFLMYRYWLSAMIVGFGIQAGLFWFVYSGMHMKGLTTTASVGVGAGSSAGAMVACCAHHLIDILPLVGLSGVSLYLARYQTYFFALAIIFNLLGISYMAYIIKTKKCPRLFKFKK